MALINGANVAIQLFLSGAWTDITCDTTSASWTWGASEALGPLTECEGGTLRVSLYDPTRKYDPDNPSSPFLGVLQIGLGFRVTVDGAAAWTGVLQTWGWDHASQIADLNGLDPIGQLSVRLLPDEMQLLSRVATSAEQAQFVLAYVQWPTAKQYFPNGIRGEYRGNQYVSGSALDGLHEIRFAELGKLFPMRDGRIGWIDRGGVTPPASSAVINCGGVGLTDMWQAMGLGRLRNHIVLNGGYGTYGPNLPPDQYRSVTGDPGTLAFGGGPPYPAPPPVSPLPPETPQPWDLWANYILDRLNPPPVLTVLGTMIPIGAQVKQIACAEFGAVWTVKATGQPDHVVQVIGQRVSIAPGTFEVDAITEPIVTAPTFIHKGASLPSYYLHQISGVVDAPVSSGLVEGYVGQDINGDRWETFLWFDTSAIPSGATVTRAEFGGQVQRRGIPAAPVDPGPVAFTDFDLQLRSYPSGGWMPSLVTADWIAPASMSTYPIRATLNTSRAYRGGIFIAFDDVSLAAAIKKGAGAQTQLVITSSRHAAGTAPTSLPESVYLTQMRLRVYYS
jgi:hypothetical protein